MHMQGEKRLTIVIPVDLHRKFKVACAIDDVNMSEAVRDLIEQEYGRLAQPEKGRAKAKSKSGAEAA
jgi:hypothetical protein